ncbi:hypothetical protein AMAG_06381 [Allomyces macrogynus ATCC 38327]|uniref:Cytochrome b5 heme-binding domain-containing protein n=1 Tax=Allomyces macrogynus (strain ATCC 38327) TaxID=578462 RepID=A0A0L0SGJ2_ALLM3|nr:hypothetical protein AMAG_06381 [Allomyces macrogynus ATCC 38327]|eukprot:KNE61564.1 hypothetical protein AMAG_06381 [Allomyces macrogynus ATCC 38327]
MMASLLSCWLAPKKPEENGADPDADVTDAPASSVSDVPDVHVDNPPAPTSPSTVAASAPAGGVGRSSLSPTSSLSRPSRAASPPRLSPAASTSPRVQQSALPPRNQNRSLLSPVFPTLSSAQRVSSPSSSARKKVGLEPGHSPLDWARLKSSGADLKGADPATVRLTMEEVAKHATEDDAWTVLHGKVFNLTPYMKYHPGGVKQLMKGAGKDSTRLFMAIHAWVNAEYLLDACFIGYLEQ